MKTERWVFTDNELAYPESCTATDEFIADVAIEDKEIFANVLVQRNGVVTNRYADGTKGVSKEISELANACDSLADSMGSLAENWRDVVTDGEGLFLGFAMQVGVILHLPEGGREVRYESFIDLPSALKRVQDIFVLMRQLNDGRHREVIIPVTEHVRLTAKKK